MPEERRNAPSNLRRVVPPRDEICILRNVPFALVLSHLLGAGCRSPLST